LLNWSLRRAATNVPKGSFQAGEMPALIHRGDNAKS